MSWNIFGLNGKGPALTSEKEFICEFTVHFFHKKAQWFYFNCQRHKNSIGVGEVWEMSPRSGGLSDHQFGENKQGPCKNQKHTILAMRREKNKLLLFCNKITDLANIISGLDMASRRA